MSQTPTARSIALVGSVSLTVGFALLIGYRPSALPASVTEPLTQGTEALGDRRIVLLTGGLLAVIGLVGFGFWNGRDTDTGFDTTSVETPTRDVSITGERLTTAFEQTANAHSAETPSRTHCGKHPSHCTRRPNRNRTQSGTLTAATGRPMLSRQQH